MRFLDPAFFLLLGLVPMLVIFELRQRGRNPSVRYSSNHAAVKLPSSLRSRMANAPFVLRLLALVCLVVGLARPVVGMQAMRSATRGIAIEMVIDRSGSMRSSMAYDGRRESRLAVVKQVFRSFVNGKGRGLTGRPNDLIGLVTFARYADTICPLTLDHKTLDAFLKQIHPPLTPSLDGTAIGDGIALAAAHLKTLGSEIGNPKGRHYHVKSKVIILLTDGQNNFGRISPLQAAALAKKWGIRIYTIGIGGNSRPVTINSIFGPQALPGVSAVDVSMLRKIASTTGGLFQLAQSGSGLREVYRKIDSLEKSSLPTTSYVDWKEAFLPFALAALLLVLAEMVLGNTLLRRIP